MRTCHDVAQSDRAEARREGRLGLRVSNVLPLTVAEARLRLSLERARLVEQHRHAVAVRVARSLLSRIAAARASSAPSHEEKE